MKTLLAIKSINKLVFKMLRLTKWLILILFTSNAAANCNFVSSDFISELSIPKNIQSIDIIIPKSEKFNKNFVKILTSKNQNILPELKISYRANITVNYSFGKCVYKGTVRQHGDWKDHIILKDGNPLRSLKISLENGNILNAIKFRLIIPNSRGDLNEVLGTVLMRELGYIAPETFQVLTKINNVQNIMLFQEDIRKELLEKNKRREGPILEGDESLLWSYKKFENLALEPLSLSRIKNEKWFLKGKSSQEITLDAYSQLQKNYLDYSYRRFNSSDKSNPFNTITKLDRDQKIFNKYFIILMAMDGLHGLRPHNRQYYYNVFLQKLEPIYYDGDLNLNNTQIIINEEILKFMKSNESYSELLNELINLKSSKKTISKLYNRVLIKREDTKDFYENSISNTIKNTSIIIKKFDKIKSQQIPNTSFFEQINQFSKFEKEKKINQIIITELKYSNKKYLAKTLDNKKLKLTIDNVAELISSNMLKENRAVYIPKVYNSKWSILKKKKIKELSGEIFYSEGLKIILNKKNKEITFKQSNEFDWVLLRDVNLDNWKIIFLGIKPNNLKNSNKQGFNSYGITGCLNFYNSTFKDTLIRATNGACEDLINIVKSKGNFEELYVKNAYADAIDIDFSKININNIYVNKAGNDCLDVSGGDYKIEKIIMTHCGDKGLSVGEHSNLYTKDTYIDFTKIAVSSKDSSQTKIDKANYQNVEYCYEVKRKKKEFGGAILKFGSILCDKKFMIDNNSRVEIKYNEF
jgi:hypothetical protein